MKNPAAVALGKMAKGVPKTLTDEQRKFRAAQLAAARLKRHSKPKRKAGNLEEIGGCDHSVGICCCDEIRNLETAITVIAKATGKE